MSKNKYVYLELLRQVCPYKKPFFDFDFFLLGSFDAMSVDSGCSIYELKKKYETKHRQVLSVFDRQPIYLYSKEIIDIEDDNCIFSNCDKFENIPLILTLFQMDKRSLADNRYERPEVLIEKFTEMLNSCLKPKYMKFQVFWNLGESDIAVVFRSNSLNEIADLLHNLRINGYSSETMKIISTASQCAFPKPIGIEKCSEDEQRKLILNSLNKWLPESQMGVETESSGFNYRYESSEFITLGNVASCDNPHFSAGNTFSFLFGEWDYLMRFEDMNHLKNHLRDTFMCLITRHKELSAYAPFRISYTIPMFSLQMNGEDNMIVDTNPSDEYPIDDLEKLSEAMDAMVRLIESHFSELRKQGLIEEINSFNNTLQGLGRFLYRLRIGRFEEDLYAYIQPVFVRLEKITRDYVDSIDCLCTTRNIEKADNLVIEYLEDTSRLIENLQHLFSIMAVSPHTYMETYGSNMRSLAAADKLLDSYQGIIQYLKDNFPDQIRNENGEIQTCEREILIFPYRKTKSQHTLLYRKSNPLNRISYISLDFSKMFSLQATIFMLLHECGHHLGNRLRLERFKCFYGALTSFVICHAGVKEYIQNPIGYLVKITMQKESNELDTADDLPLLLRGLGTGNCKRISATYERRIREEICKNISAVGISRYNDSELLTNYKDYCKRKNDLLSKRVLWDNYYSAQIKSYLYEEGIPQYFGVDKTEKNTAFTIKMRESLKEDLTEVFALPFKKITEDMAKDIADCQGNIREALRIKTLYADTEQIINDIVDPIGNIIISKRNDGSFDSLLSVFSNIYSDLFAISILDLKQDEYVSIIPKLIGIERIDSINTENLLRVYTVSNCRWHNSDLSMFKKSFNTEISEEIIKTWDLFQYDPLLPFLKHYAEKCSEELENSIQAIKSGSDVPLKKLKRMFDAGDTQIEGIYYFYQYLMRKGE